MASAAERDAVAAELWAARRSASTIAPPSARFAGWTLDDGYAVGATLHAWRVASGERRTGLKIGFTNRAVWASLGLADPIVAPLYRSSVRDLATGGHVDLGGMTAPAIEPEIVLGIAGAGIAWWALGFEIVQCHFPAWRMMPADAVADEGLHGALIVGVRVAADARPLGTFAVELRRDGAPFETATTEAVLGGPLLALERALAIARERGIPPPQPGEIVTTGTLTSAPRVAAGETWEIRAPGGAAPPLAIRLR